jgi:hypothetical protein
MPIEQIPAKQLGDYWHPTEMAGLAAQAQSLGIQTKRLQLQEANQQFDNALAEKKQTQEMQFRGLFEMYKVAPNDEVALKVGNQLAKMIGVEPFVSQEQYNRKKAAFDNTMQALAGDDPGGLATYGAELAWLDPAKAEYVQKIAPDIHKQRQLKKATEGVKSFLPPGQRTDEAASYAVQNDSLVTEYARQDEKKRMQQTQLDAVDRQRTQAKESYLGIVDFQKGMIPLTTPMDPYQQDMQRWLAMPTLPGKGGTLPIPKGLTEFAAKAPTLLPQAQQAQQALAEKYKELLLGMDTMRGGNLPENLPPDYAKLEATKGVMGVAMNETNALVNLLQHPTDRTAHQQYQEARRFTETQKQEELQRLQIATADRNLLHQNKDLLAARTGEGQFFMERRFTELLSHNMGETQAASMAAEDAARKYPGTGLDMTKLKDPSKAGRLTLEMGSPGEREKIAEGRAVIGSLDELEKSFKPEYVGPIDRTIGSGLQALNLASPEATEFRSALERYRVEQQHRIYGSALTESEKKEALNAIPNLGMSDTQFPSAIRESRKWEQRILQQRQTSLTPKGIQATPLEELRKQFPNESVEQLERFLKQRK